MPNNEYYYYMGRAIGDSISVIIGAGMTVEGLNTMAQSIAAGAAATVCSGGVLAVGGVAISIGGAAAGSAAVLYGGNVIFSSARNFSSDIKKMDEAEGAGNTYSNFAKQATKNANSTEVVLGKYNQGGVSYTKVAEQRGATYFQLANWDNVVKEVGEKNIWNINESFIRQQASANKAFILSHDPAQATGYFANEVNLLKDMGYRFIQEGSVWRAVK